VDLAKKLIKSVCQGLEKPNLQL